MPGTDNQQPSRKLKCCKRCGRKKPIDRFQVYDSATEARRNECIECRRIYQAAWARGEIQREDGVFRVCRKCSEKKRLEAFPVVYALASRGKNYQSHTCAKCSSRIHSDRMRKARVLRPDVYRRISRRAYWKNRDKKNAARREWTQRLRDQVFAAYGGYRCNCCGETKPSMLTIDHINNDGGKQRKADPVMRWAKHFYAWIIKRGFPKDLQVLCYNCNISKFRCGGTCEHKLPEGSTTIPQGSRGKRLEMPSTPTG